MIQLRNISLITLLLLYISAGLGYGLHICSDDGSVTPLLMIQDATCENVHDHVHYSHHSGCDGGCTNHGGEGEGCCHTEVFHLEDIYEKTVPAKVEHPVISLLPVISGVNQGLSSLTAISEEVVTYPEFLPPESIRGDLYTLISVWRL